MAQAISKMETTAVEWFRQELLKRDFEVTINELFERAKAMEKEQIIKAYANGSNDRLHNFINEQYYNETYKK